MTRSEFVQELEARIARYDLLCHPFYKAWSAGTLTREDLQEYSAYYYHQVAAFPRYLSSLHSQLEDSELRRAVLRNLADEEVEGTPHSELWLDFAEGMGNEREAVRSAKPAGAMQALIATFEEMARTRPTASALAAFYAYESQIPRVAKAKAEGLKEWYGASDVTRRYFTLHTTADVRHSQVWKQELESLVEKNPEAAEDALRAAEQAAQALWKALDEVEEKRLAKAQ